MPEGEKRNIKELKRIIKREKRKNKPGTSAYFIAKNVKRAREKLKKEIAAGIFLIGGYVCLNCLAETTKEKKDIDRDNKYINEETSRYHLSIYEKRWKPLLDKGLSFLGLLILAPVYGIISLAIYADDPGPVFFTQKRVGKDKHYFELHKFRSMKKSAPHDTPTHQLRDPEKYITRVGKILRRTSLDELPQIWDIFRGKMSIIGPRPALWNQADLVAEREKYGANSILPGLTGLAQIRGRDELEIPDKARLDGRYAAKLRKGGIVAFVQDAECFFGTIRAIFRCDGIVEGGTGCLEKKNSIKAIEAWEAGFEDYGYKKRFHIDTEGKKRVLITGAGSYIGESFASYAKQHYPNIETAVLDMATSKWKETDFTGYDSIFHVAGIAHADTGSVTEEEQKLYYTVNRDLAVETAKAAKEAGVKQFILMSSIIVYGDSAPYRKQKVIDEFTIPSPSNFYGDSKWQADKGVRELATSEFCTAIIRAPMVYGPGSKGNYRVLSKIAKALPAVPDVENHRSMLYIGNLCEFLCLLICSGEGGVYFPQNSAYVKTTDMVKEIRKVRNKGTVTARILAPAVGLAVHVPGKIGRMACKAFGNSICHQKLSIYEGIKYRVFDFPTSIKNSEL